MNAIETVVNAITLNAVVFSNFPDDVFENELGPKLIEFGVRVLRVYRPDRVAGDNLDMSQADVVIEFGDFMSHSQSEAIRKKVKILKRPLATLRRQSSEWPKVLGPMMARKSAAEIEEASAPPSLSSHVKQAMNTYRSLVSTGVGEDEILQAVRSVPDHDRLTSLVQVETLFEAHLDRAPAEFRSWWQAQKKARLVPPPQAPSEAPPAPLTPEEENEALRAHAEALRLRAEAFEARAEALEHQIADARVLEATYEEEIKKIREEHAGCPAEVMRLKEECRRMLQQYNGAQGAKAAADQRHKKEIERLEAELTRLKELHGAKPGVDVILMTPARHDYTVAMEELKVLRAELADMKHAKERLHGVAKATQDQLEATVKQMKLLEGDRATSFEEYLQRARTQITASMQDELTKLKSSYERRLHDANKAATAISLERDGLLEELSQAKASTTTGEGKFDAIVNPLKKLYELGVLSRKEIAEKLVHQVLGDKS